MNSVFVESHFLPSLEYFTVIGQSDKLIIDTESKFRKQTFRNRTRILSANGVLPLIVPVHYKSDSILRDVKIDYEQAWIRQHKGAFFSAYGKSPFFEHFSDLIYKCWDDKPKFLTDLNHAFLSVSLKLLQWQIDIVENSPESDSIDLRDKILSKRSFESRDFYQPNQYQQNFGNTFVPNLSILDLLMCQGPESGRILKNSIQTPIERFHG